MTEKETGTDSSNNVPMIEQNNLNSARSRIEAAFDAGLFHDAGRYVTDRLHEHFRSIQSSTEKVLNWHDPQKNVDAARKTLRTHADGHEQSDMIEHMRRLVQTMLSRGLNLHDPRYIGHQVPAPVPIAGLFDAIGSTTNQVMAIYEMGPWATAVERAVVEELGTLIGWPEGSFAGLATHGGSLANLTALTTARNVRMPNYWEHGVDKDDAPVIVSHTDAHYCIARAAGMLGLGTRNLIRAELDGQRRIDPDKLDTLLASLRRQNRKIVAVVACACATPIGAFDPLEAIAEVCRRHEVWLHVDAAHGGAVMFSQRYRDLLRGIDQVDSLIWDAHKMMFVPALCAFVFYRDKDHRFETFRQDAPYLFDPAASGMAEFDSGLVTVECTKRAAAFGLWGTWSMFGARLFGDLVDVTFDVARQFHRLLEEAPDFQALHVPEANIVVFRYWPDQLKNAEPEQISRLQNGIRHHLIKSGEFYIVQAALDGMATLRVAVCNPLTKVDHLRELMHAIRRHGKQLLGANERSGSRA